MQWETVWIVNNSPSGNQVRAVKVTCQVEGSQSVEKSLTLTTNHYLQVLDSSGQAQLLESSEAQVGDRMLVEHEGRMIQSTISDVTEILAESGDFTAITTESTNLICSGVFVSSLTTGGVPGINLWYPVMHCVAESGIAG